MGWFPVWATKFNRIISCWYCLIALVSNFYFFPWVLCHGEKDWKNVLKSCLLNFRLLIFIFLLNKLKYIFYFHPDSLSLLRDCVYVSHNDITSIFSPLTLLQTPGRTHLLSFPCENDYCDYINWESFFFLFNFFAGMITQYNEKKMEKCLKMLQKAPTKRRRRRRDTSHGVMIMLKVMILVLQMLLREATSVPDSRFTTYGLRKELDGKKSS